MGLVVRGLLLRRPGLRNGPQDGRCDRGEDRRLSVITGRCSPKSAMIAAGDCAAPASGYVGLPRMNVLRTCRKVILSRFPSRYLKPVSRAGLGRSRPTMRRQVSETAYQITATPGGCRNLSIEMVSATYGGIVAESPVRHRMEPGSSWYFTWFDSSDRRRPPAPPISMLRFGSLMSQVLQCAQFCALIT